MGICKCIYKHIPLDELNTTLEIVFSTQIYLTISVDGVRCVFLQLTCLQASSLEFPGDCLMGGRRGKTFVSALRLSFFIQTGRLPAELGQMFKSANSESSATLGCLFQDLKQRVNPSITGLGNCVTHSYSLSLPSLNLTCRHRQTV